MRKTKIVCTLGPAIDNEDFLREIMKSGMNVARMNFSHGNYEEHGNRIEMVKKLREELNLPVALLLDTKGPEIRIKNFKGDNGVFLEEGNYFTLMADDVEGDETKVSVTYKDLCKDVNPGNRILIADGLIELEVLQIEGTNVKTKILNGGQLGNNKGVNLPNIKANLPFMTPKDEDDIKFGIDKDIDFIAASFVRRPADVIEIRKVLEENGGSDIKIIAKIENREGIDNCDEIIKVSDGIMVARGDLGVEIPVEEVPRVQKDLIKKCYKAGKPVITATQMLESMITNPRPTRAEASDIANAIYDGTSAIMLSGETAMGKYPIECVETMDKIARKTESAIDYWGRFHKREYDKMSSVTNAISHATCTTAHDLEVAAIITVTHSGHTARMISRFRPECPIIATTISEKARRQLNINWGVLPFLVKIAESTDEIFDTGVEKAMLAGLVRKGDLVVITAGVPIGISGTTNILKVHVVGQVLVQGKGIGKKKVTKEIYVANSTEDAIENFVDGNVFVAAYTNNDMMPVLKKASAIIVEEEGTTCHAAITGLALGIPVITSAENATKILKTGSVVTVDGERGIVYYGNEKTIIKK
jgi:pyruvate kinase